jgi:hypothetical protein
LPTPSPKPLFRLCPEYTAGPRRRNTSPNTNRKEKNRNKPSSIIGTTLIAFLCFTAHQLTKHPLMMIAVIRPVNQRKDSKLR